MPSNDGSGAKGALALLALVALIVLAMQVMDQIAGEWRREYSGVKRVRKRGKNLDRL